MTMTNTAHTPATDPAGHPAGASRLRAAACRRSAPLPAGTVVPIEFMPGDPGEHEFTCQMGMLRGRIIVEAA